MRYRLEQDRQSRRQEKEVQLELRTPSLLILLGVLAVICGLFYALGYTIGRHSAPQTFSLNSTPPPVHMSQTRRRAQANGGARPPNPAELSAAEQGHTPATLTPTPTPTSISTTTPAPSVPAPQAPAASTTATPANPPPASPAAAGAGGQAGPSAIFSVQVFAGVIRSDAVSLAAALKARQYPVFVVSPTAGQKLYRVQVGPYTSRQEAEAMRARLLADGYTAVIKSKS